MKFVSSSTIFATAALLSSPLLPSCEGATRVAVLEFGQHGMVRRTTATRTTTSVEGVASFWSALHGYGRKLQHAGMPVVPDLFSRPDDGLVVSLTSVDLDDMPTVSALLLQNNNNDDDAHVVGHLKVPGSQAQGLMKRLSTVEHLESADSLIAAAKTHCKEQGMSGMDLAVTQDSASTVDATIGSLVTSLDQFTAESGKSIVLHLVIEEEEGAARRRLTTRRLNEDEEEDRDEEDDRDEEQDEEGENNNNNNNNANGNNNGYYGYGYYNDNGEWVTPYKTMFQIQYFNVVLWTSVGLVAVMFYTIYLMMNMPLMADTLLFGESAQMVAAD